MFRIFSPGCASRHRHLLPMKQPKSLSLQSGRAALAALVLTGVPAQATVTLLNGFTATTAEVSDGNELAYQANVSSSDLLNGKIPVTTGWNITNGASPNEMTDGSHGQSFAAAGNQVDGGWTTSGATATYALGGGTNGLGYDLTSILTVASWTNVGFGNQAWTIAVRPVGGSFTDLAAINYQPLGGAAGGSTMVSLSNLSVTGVDAIRFTANTVNGGANAGAFVTREIDVSGSSTVPEPGSALLGACGAALLVLRRRPVTAG